MKTLSITVAALAFLILAGMVNTASLQDKFASASIQVSLFSVILSSLSTLLTPFSSALGIPSITAPSGELIKLGLSPLLAWSGAGVLIGLLSRRTRNAISPALLTPAIVYLLILGLSIYVLPRLPEAINWEVYLSEVASTILLEGPLDFVFIYLLPVGFATLSSTLMESVLAKPAPVEPQRRRFWEWVEEE